ncbi:protein of unknown function [Ralstonia solanacearum CMR15]|nr:protein of unknown function [Ralstonia solanacearum CMR15]
MAQPRWGTEIEALGRKRAGTSALGAQAWLTPDRLRSRTGNHRAGSHIAGIGQLPFSRCFRA